MKYPLIGVLCLSILVISGCQSYPKNPIYPTLTKRVAINHIVPEELRPFELPPKVQYMDAKQTVPKTIIVSTPVIAPTINVPIVSVTTPIAAVSPVSTVAAVMPQIEVDIHAK